MTNLICWWFGHKDPDVTETCERCGAPSGYEDWAGITRHQTMLDFFEDWFRKVWPRRCWDCGRRFRCDSSVFHDDCPF